MGKAASSRRDSLFASSCQRSLVDRLTTRHTSCTSEPWRTIDLWVADPISRPERRPSRSSPDTDIEARHTAFRTLCYDDE
jgi:hypothetical protein